MAEANQLKQIWENFAFTRLLKTFRLSVGPSKLLTALAGIILICVFGWLMDACTKVSTPDKDKAATMKPGVASIAEYATPSEWPMYKERENTYFVLEEFCKSRGVFSTLWNFTTARFNVTVVSLLKWHLSDVFFNLWLCVTSLVWAIKFHPFYSVIFLTFSAVTMSLTGGAICRAAALEFARREKPGFTETIKFSWQKLGGFLAAPSIPLAIMIAAGSGITALGLAGNIPNAGPMIIAVGIFAALILGLFISLFLVGTIIGSSLMFPAIAYEGSNGFDAISRAFAYAYAHPWAMTFYGLVASLYGAVSYLFVRFFAFLLLIITHTLLDIGVFNASGGDVLSKIWTKPEFFKLFRDNPEVSLTSIESASALLIKLAVLIIVALLIAFVVSFYFCASTIIYSLMRERVDRVSPDKIYVHLDHIRDE